MSCASAMKLLLPSVIVLVSLPLTTSCKHIIVSVSWVSVLFYAQSQQQIVHSI